MPWTESLAGMTITEWCNDDRLLGDLGGGQSTRMAKKWMEDMGFTWKEIPNLQAHSQADESTAICFCRFSPNTPPAAKKRRRFKPRKTLWRFNAMYRKGIALAQERFRCDIIFKNFIFKNNCRALLCRSHCSGVALAASFAADPKIIEAAKKEGELAWWSTIAQDQSQKIVDEFMKLYPFIKASYWRSGSVGLHNKILIEARAGRSSWDVVSQTTPEFIFDLKRKKLIAPYNSPERGQFSADLKDRRRLLDGNLCVTNGPGLLTLNR